MNSLPRRTLVLATVLLGSISLAGCAAAGPSANVEACEAFETKHNRWLEVESNSDYTNQQRQTFRGDLVSDMDKVALSAEGIVRERLETLVDELSDDATELSLAGSPTTATYGNNAERVVNACAAEEIGITLN